MPALAAARGQSEFAEFYKHLINQGKKPMVAIAASCAKSS
jgi:transposase